MVAFMKSLCFSFIVLASLATLFSVADARRFYVGGNGAWVVNPHESYKSWAESNRFQVNDTLYFKYAKGSDSVQLVTKADYDGCNVKNPIDKFDNGETEVALDRSGHFFFISGSQDHCLKGQKLTADVLSIRNNPKVPISPAKAPSTAQPPKSHSPVSPVAPAKPPSSAESPKAHSPVSPAKPPSKTQPPKAPAKAPSTSQPPKSSVSPSHPSTPSPSKAPTSTHTPPTKSPTPSTSPRSSLSPKSPAAAPPTPSASSPPAKPPMSPPDHSPASPAPEKTPASPAPEKTPASSPTPNNMAPAPTPKSAATVVAVTSVMSTLFGAAFTVLMLA